MKKFFALFISLPITLGNSLALPINLPHMNMVAEKKEKIVLQQTEKFCNLAIDTKEGQGIVVLPKNIEIKLVQSNFEKKQQKLEEIAKEKRRIARNVISRDLLRYKKSMIADKYSLGEKRKLVQSAAARYNIPWQILEAVWQVETGKSWDTARRSYAGAMGPMQFMPTTWRRYGVDGNNDGRIDITSAYDSVYSAARYLSVSGASSGQIQRALYAYNHSMAYVSKVLSIARSIGY